MNRSNGSDPRSGAASAFSDLDAEFGNSVDVINNTIVAAANDNTLNVLDIDSGELL